ncbi:transcriptional regulator ATRX-like [Salvelinus sp. IW2-2015]|uniref:transcriptional regulator ATRX-like n=1 Tax=Salvelinus sp. IW2-2015 TaxID=2691554 RepID=UPI0038D3D3E8
MLAHAFNKPQEEHASTRFTKPQEVPIGCLKKKRGKARKKDSDSDSDALEVIKEWNTSSRGGDPSSRNRAEPEEEVRPASSPGTRSPDWHKEFVTEADSEILEHSGKMVLLFEILRMAEEVEDKVLVFSQSLISLDLIEDFLELAGRAKEEEKPSPYKGTVLPYTLTPLT